MPTLDAVWKIKFAHYFDGNIKQGISKTPDDKRLGMQIKTNRLLISEASRDFARIVSGYYQSTRNANQEFEPIREDAFYYEKYWQDMLDHYENQNFDERGARFLLFLKSDPINMVGYVNFDNVVRGVFQACTLGYALAPQCQGHGYMNEALERLTSHVFETYHLHRIQANYIVNNEKSANVLHKLGFIKEGLAKDYLLINGKWQDHILTSLINNNWESK